MNMTKKAKAIVEKAIKKKIAEREAEKGEHKATYVALDLSDMIESLHRDSMSRSRSIIKML